MPNYGTVPVTAMSPGDVVSLFNAETPAAPQASMAVAMQPGALAETALPTFQVLFPGTASVQVQGSNVDVAANYVDLGSALATTKSFYTSTDRFIFYRVNATALSGGTLTVIVSYR